jgi:secondary thiamine-phosphate synthase enzyme
MRRPKMSAIVEVAPQLIASTSLHVDTPGAGFTHITGDAAHFIDQVGAGEGVLLIYLRHTSASLAIQENADPDVQTDLLAALDRLAPEDAPWVHDVEGPDDMPAHVKAMLSGVCCSSSAAASVTKVDAQMPANANKRAIAHMAIAIAEVQWAKVRYVSRRTVELAHCAWPSGGRRSLGR